MAENWIKTDEAEDVAGSLRHVVRAAECAGEDPQAWKWVVLALHSALQGACICHLTTTAAPVGAVTKKNAAEWLEYFEASRTNPTLKPPKTHLMSLPDLLKAVRRPNPNPCFNLGNAIQISDSEMNWLSRFHETFRNQFVHFEPAGWAIEVSGIPEIAKLIARIIKDICEAGWAFRHKKDAWVNELQESLHALTQIGRPRGD